MEKVIDITAKRDGFRRAGMVHSEQTKTYPLADFTKAQLELLKSEPMLVVAIRNADDQQAGPAEDLPLVQDLRKQLSTLTGGLEEARTQVEKMTIELADERAKNDSAVASINLGKQALEEANGLLATERQKVTDLTVQLEAATKKGK